MNTKDYKIIKKSLLSNKLLGAFLLISYCVVYGFSAQYVLSGLQLLLFICSLLFALSVYYVRDPEVRKEKANKSILFTQTAGTVLVFAYVILFGVSSVTLLNGFQLIFFMSSYAFAMTLFYMRDPERIQKEENVSSSTTTAFVEKHPCFINSQDLSWLVRELNGSLATVIGFSELMLKRQYSENEKEYMLRNIYEHSINMSCSITKVSSMINDSPVKPKEIYEVVDLLDDKNFK